MSDPFLIPEETGRHILVIGEYYKNAPGGIAAVLQYYRPNWETFNFIPSSPLVMTKINKIIYGLGGLALMILRLLFDWRIRIVHIHTAAGGSFFMHQHYARAAKLLRRKLIIHSHASRFKVFFDECSEKEKKSVLKTLNSCDRLIVLSESWRRWFMSIGVKESNIEILHNITPVPSCGHKPSSDRLVRLSFLGEIGERKGVFDLLHSLANGKEYFSGHLILRIGGNGDVNLLNRTIHDLGLEKLVRFEGFVRNEKKIELLSNTDIFVLPSHNEGLPISILEAMSYNCAIISTPVGGIPEIVSDANGILVEPGDVAGLCKAVKYLMDNPELVELMGENSGRVVMSYYPEPVLSHLKHIYESLLWV